MPSCVGKPNKFWPLVGDDARAERTGQGLLVRCSCSWTRRRCYPTVCCIRCSTASRCRALRAVMTCNPAHPHHEIKRRYIDEPRESEVAFGFSLDDNPILDEEYKASLASALPAVASTAGWSSASGLRWRGRYGRRS